MNRKEIGEAGESLACEVLCRQGYRILCRNYRCPYGEIDIIAGKGGKLIFAEVKTRLSDGFGAGRDSVGSTKRSRIRRAAGYFLTHLHPWHPMYLLKDVLLPSVLRECQ